MVTAAAEMEGVAMEAATVVVDMAAAMKVEAREAAVRVAAARVVELTAGAMAAAP